MKKKEGDKEQVLWTRPDTPAPDDDAAALTNVRTLRAMGLNVTSWLAVAIQAEKNFRVLHEAPRKIDLLKVLFSMPCLIYAPRVQALLQVYYGREGTAKAFKRMRENEEHSLFAAELRRSAEARGISLDHELEERGFNRAGQAEAKLKELRRALAPQDDIPFGFAWPRQKPGRKKGTPKMRP